MFDTMLYVCEGCNGRAGDAVTDKGDGSPPGEVCGEGWEQRWENVCYNQGIYLIH